MTASLRSFPSAQGLCRAVLRIFAVQCKGFELCSAKDLLLRLIPYFSGFQRWQFQQWEAIWGGKNEKVKPIIVINIMKNTYIWGGENKRVKNHEKCLKQLLLKSRDSQLKSF